MKKLLILSVLCFSFFTHAQELNKRTIKGKIIVENNDIDGITIFNTSTNLGTVSNTKGEFEIVVSLNDMLEIRAIEYQNFNIKINQTILDKKLLNIFLIEEINMLDEVVVFNKKLTGSIDNDIKNIDTFKPKLNTIYFGKKSLNDSLDIKTTKLENIAIDTQNKTIVNGLNIINVVDQLLIPLFRSEITNKKDIGMKEVPSKSIKYYLGSKFLVENFNIPEYRVEEFIRYVEDDTFDFEMLNYGHELEFLELLTRKSKMFLKTK